jgi:hypothetical protein
LALAAHLGNPCSVLFKSLGFFFSLEPGDILAQTEREACRYAEKKKASKRLAERPCHCVERAKPSYDYRNNKIK